MRVHVDEPGRDHQAARVDGLACGRSRQRANPGDAAATHAETGDHPRCTGAVHQKTVTDEDVKGGARLRRGVRGHRQRNHEGDRKNVSRHRRILAELRRMLGDRWRASTGVPGAPESRSTTRPCCRRRPRRCATPQPVIDTSDLSVLVRAFHGPDLPSQPEPTATKDAQLTISRYDGDIFADRQIYLFVDDEPWGKVRYGDSITRELKPGVHKVTGPSTRCSRGPSNSSSVPPSTRASAAATASRAPGGFS